MKKLTLFFLFIISAVLCKAQIRMEYYYPEKFYVSKFEKATNLAVKIDAGGEMATYYAWFCKDSLRDICITRNYNIAAASEDPALVVRAKFWDAYAHNQSIAFDETDYVTTAAYDLLSYAEKYHFLDYKIAAYNILSWIYLANNDYKEAEKYAVSASLWLEDIHNDSLKIEIYGSLAHVFIYEKDGVNASRYLLKLHEYAEQDNNEAICIQAMYYLEWLYYDMGETQKSDFYNKKLYKLFAKRKDIYAQTGIIGELALVYLNTDDNLMKKFYSETLRKMQKKLDIVNFQTYFDAKFQWQNNMLSSDEYLKLLKSNFGHRFFWPKAKVYFDIAEVYLSQLYLNSKVLDSAEYYCNKAQQNGIEKTHKSFNFFEYDYGFLQLYKKQYSKAIDIFTKMKSLAKKNRNIDQYNASLNGLITCYENLKDFETANKLLTEYYHISDSLVKLNNKQEITMMEVEKDKEINDRKLKDKEAKLEHRHNIQYMGMALGALAIILVLILLGLIKARPWVIRSMSFFSFIFIFEFIILILDNQIHEITGGEPWKIMMIKVVVIGLLLPLHHFVEKKVAHNLIHKNLSPGKIIKTIWGDRIHKPDE